MCSDSEGPLVLEEVDGEQLLDSDGDEIPGLQDYSDSDED